MIWGLRLATPSSVCGEADCSVVMRSPCAGDALDPSESVRWRRPRPPVMDSGGFKKTVSLDCHGTNTLVDVDGSVSELQGL